MDLQIVMSVLTQDEKKREIEVQDATVQNEKKQEKKERESKAEANCKETKSFAQILSEAEIQNTGYGHSTNTTEQNPQVCCSLFLFYFYF